MAKEAQPQEIPVKVQKEYFEKQLKDLQSKEEQLYFQLDQVQSAKLVFAIIVTDFFSQVFACEIV